MFSFSKKTKGYCFLFVISFLFLIGCSSPHRVRVIYDITPKDAKAYVGGKETFVWYDVDGNGNISNPTVSYDYIVTQEDIRKGQIEIPEGVIKREGYLPYKLPKDYVKIIENGVYYSTNKSRRLFWQHNRGSKYITYCYVNRCILQKNTQYSGLTNDSNKVRLTVNSEPQGSRIYSDGKHVGTTPCGLYYSIEPKYYKTGELVCKPLIAINDGYLPQEQKLTFNIDPDWKYSKEKSFDYTTLFILKRDPDYKPPAQIVQQNQQTVSGNQASRNYDVNVNINKEETELDQILKFYKIWSYSRILDPEF